VDSLRRSFRSWWKVPRKTSEREEDRQVTFFSGIFIALLGLFDLSMLILLIVTNLFMFAPVFYGFKVWVKTLGAKEVTLT